MLEYEYRGEKESPSSTTVPGILPRNGPSSPEHLLIVDSSGALLPISVIYQPYMPPFPSLPLRTCRLFFCPCHRGELNFLLVPGVTSSHNYSSVVCDGNGVRSTIFVFPIPPLAVLHYGALVPQPSELFSSVGYMGFICIQLDKMGTKYEQWIVGCLENTRNLKRTTDKEK